MPRRNIHFQVLMLIFCSGAVAQQETGSIAGEAVDPSGATVVGAAITVRNQSTNATLAASTDASGFYRFPQLAPGEYTVTASVSGFRTLVRTGIIVRVNDRLRIDFALELGGVSEKVTVNAPAPLLQTEDATTGQVIENRRITELPLNGRSALQLATLAPATVVYSGNAQIGAGRAVGNAGQLNMGGTRTSQNNYLINGFNNNFFVAGAGPVVQPPVDSLQEFKVETNNYTADTGRLAGAVINAIIKSGSNAFHGTVYEFFRNRELNARNFFASGTARKPEFTRNQFGASAGGPFIRNRLFFFLNYEGNRQREDRITTAQVFSDAMKAGNFSSLLGASAGTDALGRPVLRGQIFDPFSLRRLPTGTTVRDAFPGNQIPLARMNPVAKTLIDLAPPPNASGSPNFVRNLGAPVNVDTFIGRVDWVISPKNTLASHFAYLDASTFTAPLFGLPLDGSSGANSVSSGQRMFGLAWTNVFRATDLNEFRIGYVRDATLREPVQSDATLDAKYGIPFPFQGPRTGGLTSLQISGFGTLGTASGPYFQFANAYELSEGYTAIRGSHSLKFGLRIALKLFQNQKNCDACRGGLVFNGVFTSQPGLSGTGSSVADFLMGTANSASLGSVTNEKDVGHDLDWYVQDRWRASKKLTVTVGLRYQYYPPGGEARDLISSVVYGSNYSNPQIIVPKGQSDAIFARMRDIWFPFIAVRRADELDRGLVHNPRKNFAPRLGLAYQLDSKTVLRAGYGVFFGFPDVVAGAVLTVNPPSKLSVSATSNTIDPTLLIDKSVFGLDPFAFAQTNLNYGSIRNVNLPPEFTQMYNLTVQRELSTNWLLEVGFLGNRASRVAIVNQINDAAPALPSDSSAPQSRRRVSKVMGNLPLLTPEGFSNYNAMVVSLEKRLSHGLNLAGNYTWSRALGVAPPVTLGINNAPIQDPLNLKREYGPLEFDVVNRLSLSLVYELPFGRGKAYLSRLSGIWRQFTDGWQVNGLTALQGGLPITPVLSTSLGKTFTNSRPNAVGDPSKTSRQPDDWINPGAFVVPSNAEVAGGNFFGNAGRGSIREPLLSNLDLSLAKNFAIRESVRLQFRAECYNFTNTPFFGNPGSVGTVVGTATFGKVTSAGDPRVIQFGLKLLY
jgi:hypothetical protein